MLFASLVPFVVLATSVAAEPTVIRDSPPLISLPMVRNIPPTGSVNLTQRDRKRFENLVKGIQKRDSSASPGVTNVDLNDLLFIYLIDIGVGNPPTNYSLIPDTGSSNTWLGANKAYVKTTSSKKTGNSVFVEYGSGFFTGIEYNDTVTISPGVAINQSIGVASISSGFYLIDGVLGIGPKIGSFGTLYPDNNSVIPTVTDNLFTQGKIKENLLAVSFQPTTEELTTVGELTFGGTDPSKYTGNIHHVSLPITKSAIANQHWGVDAAVRYGDATNNITILDTTAGVVDTGTSYLGLATDAYNLYLHETGAVFDDNTGLPRINSTQYGNLKSLFFDIGGIIYELNANAQIWPRSLNNVINGDKNGIYLAAFDMGSEFPSGTLDFIAGITFLNRFYAVFDTTKQSVGLATTQFTNSTNIN